MPKYLIVLCLTLGILFVLNILRVVYAITKLGVFRKSYKVWKGSKGTKQYRKLVRRHTDISHIAYKVNGYSVPIVYCLDPGHLFQGLGSSRQDVLDELDRAIWRYKRKLWFRDFKFRKKDLTGFWGILVLIITVLGSVCTIIVFIDALFDWRIIAWLSKILSR